MQSAKAVNRYKMSCHAGHSRYLFGSGGLPTLVALLLSTRHLVAFVRGRAGLDRRVSLDPGRRVLLIGSVEGSGGYVSQASQSMRVSRCESVDASQRGCQNRDSRSEIPARVPQPVSCKVHMA
jgi:hypothetical protein